MGLTTMRPKLRIPPEILPILRSALIAKWATEYPRDRNVRRYRYEIEEPPPPCTYGNATMTRASENRS
jgi:hypothetical protein